MAAILGATLAATRAHVDESIRALESERRALRKQYARDNARLQAFSGEPASTDLLAELQDRIRISERRLTEIQEEIAGLGRQLISEDEVDAALSRFEPVWDSLSPGEQQRIVRLLVERVDWDAGNGDVSITFHPTGIKTLVEEEVEV